MDLERYLKGSRAVTDDISSVHDKNGERKQMKWFESELIFVINAPICKEKKKVNLQEAAPTVVL